MRLAKVPVLMPRTTSRCFRFSRRIGSLHDIPVGYPGAACVQRGDDIGDLFVASRHTRTPGLSFRQGSCGPGFGRRQCGELGVLRAHGRDIAEGLPICLHGWPSQRAFAGSVVQMYLP